MSACRGARVAILLVLAACARRQPGMELHAVCPPRDVPPGVPRHALATAPGATGGAALVVLVQDGATQKPLPGARVILESGSRSIRVATGNDGGIVVTAVPDVVSRLNVASLGFDVTRDTVTARAGYTDTVFVALLRATVECAWQPVRGSSARP